MAYSSTSAIGRTLDLVVTRLAANSAWQAIAGGTSAAAAKRIVTGIGGPMDFGAYIASDGTSQTASAPLAIAWMGSHDLEPSGAGRFRRAGDVIIDLVLPAYSGTGATIRDSYAYGLDTLGAIIAGLEADRISGALAWSSIRVTGAPIVLPPSSGSPSWMTGCTVAQITISWEQGT